jgi:hypothetical protein
LAVLGVSLTSANFVVNANPYRHEWHFSDVDVPESTEIPTITILTPENNSFFRNNFALFFNITIPKTNGEKSFGSVNNLYYKASWEPRETQIKIDRGVSGVSDNTSIAIDFFCKIGGNHSLTIYGEAHGSYIADSKLKDDSITMVTWYERFTQNIASTVYFTIDLLAPQITMQSPQNKTYTTPDVPLDFKVNEATSQLLYCLDGNENQTITQNITLSGLGEGLHNVTVYATDLAGNVGPPKTTFFRVDLPDPFPIELVTGVIAGTVIAGLCTGIFYVTRHKRHK